ncbi:MAG: stage II sporulation protein M [Brumimicrobium sp.]|nr:stage II sporulation protein M [Brumimicrobium sp.]MCO5269167.1 stage II sporulation protein M [Brumimicrobium sp.]
MREIAFIKQNKEKWIEIEEVVQGKAKKNPDELSSLYVQLMNDLSFSQSYYPKSKTTIYLNYLTIQIYQKIYKTKRVEKNRLKSFFTEEVPFIMYANRRILLFTFVVFFLFVGIGILSTIHDKEFAKLILGESYINMTIENIKEGNAIGVYESGSNWGSAILIIMNNLGVAARMFIYGVFAGIGTLLFMIYNGIMLGTFQYFFVEYGALGESARGIWIHGAFEISAIVIDAMAGFVLGASILFPKTYSRIDSFKIGFMEAMKIFISTIPFIVMAGLLEGFITRYALKMPLILNLIIIFGTLGLIFYYYVIYPYRIHVKSKKLELV